MIHAIKFNSSSHWEVWTDTEVEACDGRCIGSSPKKLTALKQARRELAREMREVDRLIIEEEK